MASNLVERQVVALIYRDGDLLFVKRPDGGYDLPFVAKPGLFHKKALRRYLRETLGFEPAFQRKIPQIVVYGTNVNFLVDAYVVEVIPFADPKLPLVSLPLGGKGVDGLSPVAQALGHRGDIYAPLYLDRKRTVPLLERDQERVYWELDCIRWFGKKRIPEAEVFEFEGLIFSCSSLRRINQAFADLCNKYRCDPRDYVAFLQYREERREALNR